MERADRTCSATAQPTPSSPRMGLPRPMINVFMSNKSYKSQKSDKSYMSYKSDKSHDDLLDMLDVLDFFDLINELL